MSSHFFIFFLHQAHTNAVSNVSVGRIKTAWRVRRIDSGDEKKRKWQRERDGKGVEEGGHGESSTFSSTRCQRQVMWVPWVPGCQTGSVFAESANSILLQPPSLHHCSVGKAIGKMGDKRVGQHMVKWRGLILERKGGKPRMNGETGISAREWMIWRSSLEPSMIVDVK